MACPYGSFDTHFDKEEDDDFPDPKDPSLPPPQPSEPAFPINPPVFGDEVDDEITAPSPGVPVLEPLPFPVPARAPGGVPAPVPARPAAAMVRGPYPSSAPGEVAARIFSGQIQKSRPVITSGAKALSQHLQNGRASWSNKQAAASILEGIVLRVAGAGAAAAVFGKGSSGQFGPPSAPAELRSSTIAAEALIAKSLSKRTRTSGNTEGASVLRQPSPRPSSPGSVERGSAPRVRESNAPGEGSSRRRAKRAAAVAASVGAGAAAIKGVNSYRGGRRASSGGGRSPARLFRGNPRRAFSF